MLLATSSNKLKQIKVEPYWNVNGRTFIITEPNY